MKCKCTARDGERERCTDSSMALSHLGSGLARPFTSFRIFVSRSPRMYDIFDVPLRCGGSLPVGEIWKSQRRSALAAAAAERQKPQQNGMDGKSHLLGIDVCR
jgi:hypothetical protein